MEFNCGCIGSGPIIPENYIKVFRGDDTNFNNAKWLKVLLITDIDLTGFQGVFNLLGYSYTGAINTEEKSLEIEIPASSTSKFPIGPADGVFRLEDTKNRFKTVSNTIPFYITNTVFTEQPEEIILKVPEDYPINLKLQVYSSGTGDDIPPAGTNDYNELENLPTFNGKPWTGAQTYQSADIAPLSALTALEEVVDEKPSTLDVQNGLDGLQTQITTNKNDIAGLGDQVHEIEAKIPGTATDKNPLLTIKEIPYAGNNVNGLIQIATGAEVEAGTNNYKAVTPISLQNKLNAYTKKDELPISDQTKAGIIRISNTAEVLTGMDPTSAVTPKTLQSKLGSYPTKEEMDAAIANAGGGDVDLTGYYSENNLVAGNNVTITEVLPTGGIDAHTLACFHFDGDFKDVVSGNSIVTSGESALTQCIKTDYVKFGTGSLVDKSDVYYFDLGSTLSDASSFTIDFWLRLGNMEADVDYTVNLVKLGLACQIQWMILKNSGHTLKINSSGAFHTIITSADVSINNDFSVFTHYALTYDANTRKFTIYNNGKKCAEKTLDSNISFNEITRINFSYSSYNSFRIDEYRVSNNVRWTEDFTPPTEPYSVAVPTNKKQINAIVPEVDLSGYLQKSGGTITGNLEIASPGINPALTVNKRAEFYGSIWLRNSSNAGVYSALSTLAQNGYPILSIDADLKVKYNITNQNNKSVLWETDKGVANGVAPLGADKKVPTEYLPEQTVTVGDEKYGIRADYSLTHGIVDCPNGLIDFSINTKEIEINPGIVLQLAGAETQTTLATTQKYVVQETGKITLFLARTSSTQIGFLEAADVFWQEEEPTDGTAAYLAWYNPNVGKWQFKSDDTGNVWREAVATPVADINASETGITSINYYGYSVNDGRNCASLSDIESLEEKFALLMARVEALENKQN